MASDDSDHTPHTSGEEGEGTLNTPHTTHERGGDTNTYTHTHTGGDAAAAIHRLRQHGNAVRNIRRVYGLPLPLPLSLSIYLCDYIYIYIYTDASPMLSLPFVSLIFSLSLTHSLSVLAPALSHSVSLSITLIYS
jgi:hypothetical protein